MTIVNVEQAEHWNSVEQRDRWVGHQEQHDRMFAPFTGMLLAAAALSPGEAVLDVGCGCGATTLAAARAVAPGGWVAGVDLSVPMLARARESATARGVAGVSFEHGDAQVTPFGRRFDAAISRFGVMFFADPVAAFANLRAGLRAGGRLAFACWQPLAANEWLTVPREALARHVPLPEEGERNSPGMFALSEPGRIRGVLAGAGWRQVSIAAREVTVPVGGGQLDDAVYFLRTGSLGHAMLDRADDAARQRALASLRDALAARSGPDGVCLGAAVWLVTARS